MILERIKEYIDFKKLAVSAFEKSIGMSNASFGKSLKNGGAIGTDKLENILSIYTDINPIWLLTGEGSMLRTDEAATPLFSSSPDTVQSDAVFFRLMDKLDEKDNIIKELNARILQMSEEIGRLKAKLGEEKSYIEGLKPKTAKSVSLKEHSSQSIHDAPSVNAPLKEQ